MVEHPAGESEVVLAVEEGDLAVLVESVGIGPLAARAVVAGRLVGEFALSAEDVAHVAEHPGCGRFVLVADAALLTVLAEAELRALARITAIPPPVEAAPTGDNATGAVSAPLVV